MSYDLRSFKKAWPSLLLMALLGAVVAVLFSLTQPFHYSSTARVLITQNNVSGLDPYTAIKSTERIAASLSELIYTSSFMEEIISKDTRFDQGYFPKDEYTLRQAWKKTISVSTTPGTGIMALTVYHPKRDQAYVLVSAATHQVVDQASNYFGYNVRAQEIDTPLDSPWFAKPSFLKNAIFGFLIGLLFAIGWMLVRMGRR
jgi:capsular polysaccharide biosynthesis protein